MKNAKTLSTRDLVLTALLTAIVIVFQVLGAFIRFGPFSITLVLLPIVVGAALVRVHAGTWLGFVFGLAVLLSGDAAPFWAVNVFGTILVVLLKGALAGFVAGVTYKLLAEKSKTLAVIAAAALCPIVNTGVFIVGSYVFFLPTITEWGAAAGFENATTFLFVGMIGLNFLIELGINLVLSPVIVRLVQYGQSGFDARKRPSVS